MIAKSQQPKQAGTAMQEINRQSAEQISRQLQLRHRREGRIGFIWTDADFDTDEFDLEPQVQWSLELPEGPTSQTVNTSPSSSRNPSPQKIRQLCQVLQADWDARERLLRRLRAQTACRLGVCRNF